MSLDKSKYPVKTKIGRYHCVIDTDDGESSYCHVTDNLRRGQPCSSLSHIEALGGIDDGDGDIIPVAQRDIDAITNWAESTGLY